MTPMTPETLRPMRDLHRQAMDITNLAFAAKSRGETSNAHALFSQAFHLESEAAQRVAALEDAEPTRSILLRSAASLAYNAGLNREAEQLACLALAGEPPEDIAEELRDLLDGINMVRHLQQQGMTVNGSVEPNGDRTTEREAITGYLRIADSRRQERPSFAIIDDSHHSHRVVTPPGVLRDIVRPYFEERVTVTVRREKSRTARGNASWKLLFEGIDLAVEETEVDLPNARVSGHERSAV
jgi:hypothetical protein